jgi:hypothetical protein
MVRGVKRGEIFENDRDREDFLDRLGKVVQEGEGSCFAWVLIGLTLSLQPIRKTRVAEFNFKHQTRKGFYEKRQIQIYLPFLVGDWPIFLAYILRKYTKSSRKVARNWKDGNIRILERWVIQGC